ncbi:1-deoxy-D-xylulose-5-phosphate reductoisomerase [Eubacterium sp. An11]|uniref:1-deoxy-D-xylulose-5-phosphate reductoisomerase n=1 Tax=Eubacterium sp. An11 TaxID=1965542 RepID=UPI000B39D796|nr:1-deoxy-D-xylulose-5-phosphate reductoisomerase [Eubacterium sp. An11]OUQ69711.1 1-deoxy-D-xylulose-5-phosphate reductoisomerase [Eubacterium sp. An11]
MKKIAILGSTGSIGTQTLEVVREHKEELCVTALAAGRNKERLKEQIKEFHPSLVSLADEKLAMELEQELAGSGVTVLHGMDGLVAVAGAEDSDVVVTAVVGMMGILPTMEAIRRGKDIALANKETLVTAGHLIIPMAKEYGVSILPVDSEHSAIFQCLHSARRQDVDKILLTASGGPFRGKTLADLEKVTLEDALKHPNWSMGRKITIDSSTMVNKGLEVMEAHWLFDVDYDQIEVVVQPQSIIHSMVQFVDGAILAQLGTPDMKVPIEYALFYPERRTLSGERLDFGTLKSITFEKPDYEVFRGLSLALDAGKAGGTMPTVFNAANERAVAKFLKREIGYLDIIRLIEKCMNAHPVKENPSLEEILATEQWVYSFIG